MIPRNDDRAGAIMRAIAVTGILVSVVVGVVAWQFLGDLDRDLDQSLAIGEDAAATLTQTIDVADDVITSLDEGLGTLGVTLDTIDTTLTDTSDVASATASLAGSLPSSFADIDSALSTVESLSGTIDAALRGASRLPLGPDYDPEVPLPVAVGNLRAAFTPIGDDLAAIAEELASFADGSDELRGQLTAVQSDLERTRVALATSAGLLDAYRDTAERAGALASASRQDLERSFGWARIAAALVAILIAVSQYVPWWLGSRLRSVGEPEITHESVDTTRELEGVS
jgi:methyl-accepting chemotaxis protein